MEIRKRSEAVPRLTYAAVLALALTWSGLAVAAPLLGARALLEMAEPGGQASTAIQVISYIYYAYGTVCHQIAERSFQLEGLPCAVCARCLGIYTGYIVGLAAYPFARSISRVDTPARFWLLVALAPVATDFLGGYSGAFQNTLVSRSFTGMIAGIAGAFYTLPGLVALASTAIPAEAVAISKAWHGGRGMNYGPPSAFEP